MFPKKVVLCGKQFVGKTSIFLRMRDGNNFNLDEARSQTEHQHVDQCNITIPANTTEEGTEAVKFVLCDTVDMERHDSLSRTYYHGSAIVLFVYSVDDLDSINKIPEYYDDCKRYAEGAHKVLVRNKEDLTDDDTEFSVPLEEEDKLTNRGLAFRYKIKTSAKTGQGIGTLKRAIGKILRRAGQNNPGNNSTTDRNLVPRVSLSQRRDPGYEVATDLRRGTNTPSNSCCQ